MSAVFSAVAVSLLCLSEIFTPIFFRLPDVFRTFSSRFPITPGRLLFRLPDGCGGFRGPVSLPVFSALFSRLRLWPLPALLAVCTACGLAEDERDYKNKFEYLVFSDKTFEMCCLERYDLDGDGRVSRYEAQRVVRMDCSGRGIASLSDIAEFSLLRELDCSGNDLATLDVSRLSRLERLDCSANRLTRLDIAGLRGLTRLDCSSNLLSSLNLGGCPSLLWFDGRANRFPVLDVSGCSRSLAADLTGNQYLTIVYALAGQDVRVDGQVEIVR